jgi:putative redox protein
MAVTKTMTSSSTWKGGGLFEHTPPSGKTYVTDARLDSPAHTKENLEGPSPMEVLLGALAGCSGVDLVGMLTKMRLEITSLRFEVNTERRTECPRTFTKIHVVYDLETDPVDPAKALRAIELSVNKYCSVSAILSESAEMSYTLRYAGDVHHGTIHATSL